MHKYYGKKRLNSLDYIVVVVVVAVKHNEIKIWVQTLLHCVLMDYVGYRDISYTQWLGCLRVGVVCTLAKQLIHFYLLSTENLLRRQRCPQRKTVTTHFTVEQTSRRKTEAKSHTPLPKIQESSRGYNFEIDGVCFGWVVACIFWLQRIPSLCKEENIFVLSPSRQTRQTTLYMGAISYNKSY